MIQVIKCKGCGSVFAACREPECWTDKDWQKDVRDYAKQGHIIGMAERGGWTLDGCTCKKVNVDLFASTP